MPDTGRERLGLRQGQARYCVWEPWIAYGRVNGEGFFQYCAITRRLACDSTVQLSAQLRVAIRSRLRLGIRIRVTIRSRLRICQDSDQDLYQDSDQDLSAFQLSRSQQFIATCNGFGLWVRFWVQVRVCQRARLGLKLQPGLYLTCPQGERYHQRIERVEGRVRGQGQGRRTVNTEQRIGKRRSIRIRSCS